MALTKSRAAVTQLTASGTSTAIDISASYGHTLYVRHSNGTGTISAAATIKVQVKASGGTYVTLTTLAASTTASTVDTFTVHLPDDAASVQLVYVSPTGATGSTLDAEAGTITAL